MKRMEHVVIAGQRMSLGRWAFISVPAIIVALLLTWGVVTLDEKFSKETPYRAQSDKAIGGILVVFLLLAAACALFALATVVVTALWRWAA